MLTIKRDPHTENYTCISNGLLLDARLSTSARWFLAVILSLPEDWNFTAEGIARYASLNPKTVRSYMNELERTGYLQRRDIAKNAAGKYAGRHYCFREAPTATEQTTEEQTTQKQTTEEQTTAIYPQQNTEIQNTEIQNTDQPKVTDSSEIELQINADALRVQYGQRMTDDFIGVMAEAMNGSDRQIGGGVVSGAELRRVLSAATQEDVSNAIHATAVNSPRNHRGYFISVLYRLAGKRLTQNAAAAPKDYSGSVWG